MALDVKEFLSRHEIVSDGTNASCTCGEPLFPWKDRYEQHEVHRYRALQRETLAKVKLPSVIELSNLTDEILSTGCVNSDPENCHCPAYRNIHDSMKAVEGELIRRLYDQLS